MSTERVYPDLPLLKQCTYCVGFCTYTYENKKEVLTKPCHFCKGKGLMVLGSEAIKYELARSNRTLSDLIKAYKKELPIPIDYNRSDRGYIRKSEKEIFKQISLDISSLRRGIAIYSTYLKEKTYETAAYQGYVTLKIHKYHWVCIKCNTLDKDEHFCYGCGNENHGLSSASYFNPINEKAKIWYNEGGYKYNLGYDSNLDYTIK